MTAIPFIKKHELILALFLIVLPYIFLINAGDNYTWSKMLPIGISWLGVLLFGDFLNRKTSNDKSLLSKKIMTKRVVTLSIASVIMNFFSDVTGSWLTRLWYYPNTSPITYFTFFAPLGYLFFGLILFIFYHTFKGLLNNKVKGGRTKKTDQKKYRFIINLYPLLALILISISLVYFYNLSQTFPIDHLIINLPVEMTVNLTSTFAIWFGAFFLLEFLCFKQNKETLTRDIIRHNYIPLIAILLSSVAIIILIEWFNTPFQAWTFDNWAGDKYQFLSIPAFAYLIWPIQYLVLLPLIRLLDNSNRENVW